MTLDLFPLPSPPPAEARLIVPHPDAGITSKTSQRLVNILKDNHEKWHCFCDKKNCFHNHAAHHAVALWSLGANEQALKAGYETDKTFQLDAIRPPEEITKANWKQHLGEDRFYKAYLDFFTKAIQDQGTNAVIHEYIFAFDANFGHDESEPAMLSRLMASAFHPMMTLGSGLETGMPGLVAEGLAQAAVHKDESGDLLAPVFFKHCFEDVGVTSQQVSGSEKAQHSTFSTRLDTLMHKLRVKPRQQKGESVHPLTIMSRILKDEKLSSVKEGGIYDIYPNVTKKFSEPLRDYAGQWTMNMKLGALVQNRKEIEDKIEELAWAYTVMYGVSGWKKNYHSFHADFFLAHVVSSAMFLPSILSKLDVPSQSLLLRAHFAAALTWWVGRGRPDFDVDGFMNAFAKESPSTVVQDPFTATNPFLDIIQSAIANDESHVSEFQRTMKHWARLYGLKGSKDPRLSASEFRDADKLDGTLFISVAELTRERTEKTKESFAKGDVMGLVFQTWDRSGLYERV